MRVVLVKILRTLLKMNAMYFFYLPRLEYSKGNICKNYQYWKWVSLRIQSEWWKIWSRKTPNTDTFHAVRLTNGSCELNVKEFDVSHDFSPFLALFGFSIVNTSDSIRYVFLDILFGTMKIIISVKSLLKVDQKVFDC